MKKFIIAALCLLAGVALFLFFTSNPPAPPADNPAAQSSSAEAPPASAATHPRGPAAASAQAGPVTGANPGSAPVLPPAPPQDLSARASQVPPAINADLNLPPQTVLQNVRRAVHQYGEMFGGDPVGTNPEITAALAGKNSKQINFLNGQDGMRVNDKGELVDAWGTPYFFHQLSGTDMEIHSAGPDKIMWTSDDLVAR